MSHHLKALIQAEKELKDLSSYHINTSAQPAFLETDRHALSLVGHNESDYRKTPILRAPAKVTNRNFTYARLASQYNTAKTFSLDAPVKTTGFPGRYTFSTPSYANSREHEHAFTKESHDRHPNKL